MNRIYIGDNITANRRNLGMTQEQLAEFMGVSKSAVSKWESGTTYPDILLLPQLAALFDVSVDQLMGYEPQLSREGIRRIYKELCEAIAVEGKDKTFERCREYIKKYYSCFPFLQQIIVFYLNHSMLFEEPRSMLNEAVALCHRVKSLSGDPELAKEALILEAAIMLVLNEPCAVLDILGEKVKPAKSELELIAAAYQQMGNQEKAMEIHQIGIYQQLLQQIVFSNSYIMELSQDIAAAEETIQRQMKVIEIYDVDHLQPNAALGFYFAGAFVYALNGRKEQSLNMLERYALVCRNLADIRYLHGDGYFNRIEEWLNDLELGTMMPRAFKFVKNDIVGNIETNPAFEILKDEARFREILRKLNRLGEE